MEQVGRYRVTRRLASGKTGSLFLVFDPKTKHEVALKTVQLDWFAAPEEVGGLRQGLVHDVLAATKLRHPGIVALHNLFEEFGLTWILMEFVEGQNLLQQLADQPLPLHEELCQILRKLAEALDYAHQKGVVHGHLRPSKVLLHGEGAAKIQGFGLSRLGVPPADAGAAAIALLYLSPEQKSGLPPGPRSDQYSLAVLAWQLLGAPLPPAGMEAHEPPRGPDVQGFEPPLADVLRRALARDPSERYASCGEFVSELERALEAVHAAAAETTIGEPGELELPPPEVSAEAPAAEAGTPPRDESEWTEELTLSGAAEEPEAALANGSQHRAPLVVPLARSEDEEPASAPAPEPRPTPEDAESALPAPCGSEEAPPEEPATDHAYVEASPADGVLRGRRRVLVPLLLVAGCAAAASVYFGWEGSPSSPPVAKVRESDQLAVLPAATSGKPYAVPLEAKGGVQPAQWSVAEGELPPGLTLDTASGVVRGTPEGVGTFQFTVQAASPSQDVTLQRLAITVESGLAINTAPRLDPATLGNEYSHRLTAEAGQWPWKWSLVDGSLPSGLQLESVSGEIQGTPTETGEFSFTVEVSDAFEARAGQTFALTVNSGLAIATPEELPSAILGTVYSHELEATDGSRPYRWSVVKASFPPGISFEPSRGVVRGTPTAADVFQFAIQVRDGSGAVASRTFTLRVSEGLTIVSAGELPRGVAGTAYSHRLQAAGGETPYRWSIAQGRLPPGVELDPATGGLVGAPLRAGSFRFSLRVRDGASASASRDFVFRVDSALRVSTEPALNQGVVGQTYGATLTASGTRPPVEWSVVQGELPPGLALDPAGGLRGRPRSQGIYYFEARVRDASSATAGRTFTLVVIEPLAITTGSPLPPARPGQAHSHGLSATGGKPPYRWVISQGSLPPGLALDNNSGLITGTPVAGGQYRFAVRVTDRDGATASRNLGLDVAAPLRITSQPELPGGTVGEPYTHALAAVGAEAPYTWSLADGSLPPGLALDPATGLIDGRPTQAGLFAFHIRVAGRNEVTAGLPSRLTIAPPATGEIVWRGNLVGNRVLTIQEGKFASTGSLSGALPGVPVEIRLEPEGLRVVTAPSRENDWKLLVIHSGSEARSRILIRWTRIR